MKFLTPTADQHQEIVDLISSTFATSDGPAEGSLVSQLATDLLASANSSDMFVFCAAEGNDIVGAIILSRLQYPQDTRSVFILSPVAIATPKQGMGHGQSLILHGLNALRSAGVDVVMTYGDVNFYSKVGFAQVSDIDAQPPLTLSHPNGWLGQALSGEPLTGLTGPSFCIDALKNLDYW